MGASTEDDVAKFQYSLEKYYKYRNEEKILYYLAKLNQIPMTLKLLETTGVGKTVNAAKKFGGKIALIAKRVVDKWKRIVNQESEPEEPTSDYSSEDSVKEADNSNNNSMSDSASNADDSEDGLRIDDSNDRYEEEKESEKESDSEEEEEEEVRYTKKSKRDHSHERSRDEKKSHSSSSSSRKSEDRKGEKRKHKDEDREQSHKKQKTHHSSSSSSSKHDQSKNDEKHRSSKSSSSSSSRKHERSEEKSSRSGEKSSSKSEKSKSSSSRSEHSSKSRHDEKEKHKDKPSSNKHSYDKKDKHEKSKKEDETSKKSHSKEKSYKEDKHKSEREERVEKTAKDKDKHESKSRESRSNDSHSSKHKEEKHSKSSGKSSSSKHKEDKHDSSNVSEKRSSEGTSHSRSREGKSSKRIVHEDGIDCESGASFAEALGMLGPAPGTSKVMKKKSSPSPSKHNLFASTSKADKLVSLPQKKLEPLDINLASVLPAPTTNYRPLGIDMIMQPKQRQMTDEEALSIVISSKKERTKVYSGNKNIGQIPSLFELCIRVLQDNIDALEYTGGVPYDILKPILEKASIEQLFMLEHHNPYLMDDTDELWEHHCQKDFRNKKREEMETFRDMYMRCTDEREAKLKALTANIKLSQDKSTPVRQTKLAYVDSVAKPPRNIAKKQAKNGIVNKIPTVTPASRLSSSSSSSSKGSSQSSNNAAVPAPPPPRTLAVKPKKAPLMQKTLALMKGRFGRR